MKRISCGSHISSGLNICSDVYLGSQEKSIHRMFTKAVTGQQHDWMLHPQQWQAQEFKVERGGGGFKFTMTDLGRGMNLQRKVVLVTIESLNVVESGMYTHIHPLNPCLRAPRGLEDWFNSPQHPPHIWHMPLIPSKAIDTHKPNMN